MPVGQKSVETQPCALVSCDLLANNNHNQRNVKEKKTLKKIEKQKTLKLTGLQSFRQSFRIHKNHQNKDKM